MKKRLQNGYSGVPSKVQSDKPEIEKLVKIGKWCSVCRVDPCSCEEEEIIEVDEDGEEAEETEETEVEEEE